MLIAFSLCQGSSQTAPALISQSKFHQNSHSNEILHHIIGYGKQREERVALYLLKQSAFFNPVLKICSWYTNLQKIFSSWKRMSKPFHFSTKANFYEKNNDILKRTIYWENKIIFVNFNRNGFKSQWLLGQSTKLHRWSCVA